MGIAAHECSNWEKFIWRHESCSNYSSTRVDTERAYDLVRVCVKTPTSFSEKEVCRSSKFVVVVRKRLCFQATNYYDTYRNSRTSGLDTFGEMCTTNRLHLTVYVKCRFYCVIHLSAAILQKIYFSKRCVSKYLCRVSHTSHHNKQQASPSKQIFCELVMCVSSEQAFPPLRELHNYISSCSWWKILYLNRHKYTHAG